MKQSFLLIAFGIFNDISCCGCIPIARSRKRRIASLKSTSTRQQQQQQQQQHPAATDAVYQPLLDAVQHSQITLSSTETFRIFHGRGGCYPGCEHLTLDWFPPVFVLTNFRALLTDNELQRIENALTQKWNAVVSNRDKATDVLITVSEQMSWVYQNRDQNNVTTKIMSGEIPEPHIVTENGNRYWIQTISESDNKRHIGLFLDMANGRRWLQENADGKFILNLFSYTCAFSVAALQGGAEEVVNVDKVQGVIKIGQRNHELNNVVDGARFMSHDIFKSWGKVKKLGPFDIIVADPPSYQKGSFIAKKDYGKLIRRLPDLLTENGQALLCLNAPELDSQFLKDLVAEEAPQLKFVQRLENPESFPSRNSERALKVLLFQLASEK